jgi:hypothetical protein
LFVYFARIRIRGKLIRLARTRGTRGTRVGGSGRLLCSLFNSQLRCTAALVTLPASKNQPTQYVVGA